MPSAKRARYATRAAHLHLHPYPLIPQEMRLAFAANRSELEIGPLASQITPNHLSAPLNYGQTNLLTTKLIQHQTNALAPPARLHGPCHLETDQIIRPDRSAHFAALHRRLLDQVTAMRAELPPICRLIGPSSGSNQPLDRSLASANHRALADIEERFHLIVSKQSIGRLGEALADPLLKLDEVSSCTNGAKLSHHFCLSFSLSLSLPSFAAT